MVSQASKHVTWCMKKAQKELEECKKKGSRPKHRGLLEVKPSKSEAKKHLTKAERDLQVTEYLIKGGFADTSTGTIFYTMYQCFLAIAARFGYESGNQTCTIALIEHLIEQNTISLDKRFTNYFKYDEHEKSVIEMREEYTYGTDIQIDKTKINFFIQESKELLDATREIVYK